MLLFQLLHLGQELLKASVVVLLLLPVEALLDHILVNGFGWILGVIVVSDHGMLREGPVYFVSEVKTTIGASWPSAKMVELVRIPDPLQDIFAFVKFFRI